ncbi:transposase for insertion sequence domain protein [Mycobacteroides abscessus 5S-0422]|uniref:Transposase for insertion sequence domain protein n=1 Tax=Mycobacteroides abscessus subsp. bolletii 1513 TaxID=1299321 RepID=X8E2U2_9MYCO|nr:transposase for insertion sequence domain protein [Mycobacteroides abscessus 5S-0422]EIU06163.1 transposase for insertion sequence domain protein [Mycobacteroides abscessus 5S-0421]EIU12095.1 transposase for insertion sequence domain protein [Mycobacteroides abscessus 5S-0304]EIU21252.1 transposase for insertion sequence domain protein [Mycobacteroides abscessus 5S-0708]EIU23772.1 transposase for insertion sequence domain protein [Mycobacteroides abscessus 5S-0817]EIU29449.1 transposase for
MRIAIMIWVERTHHGRRALGRLTPIEYEYIMTPAADVAT